ncbi:glyoxylase-like metal-dependent hydrolase (beta-lactamase superfamily II) [Sinobacterium caligoides]|uniref:Glyoxylase-like metal-dependent hydrolase (Beta-lactamase superfamily II) n=1 Tax=Sinobacterium caligoides TaxID=933926 RepID=A0A3N2DZ74_9GAMM|nr:MBL fold metallo-hydrolase [Sinobacterium caligoides]ROS04759.1 glyoxylase-like metal-dependent hydrolase (beta-lactamase superfamily II) [Sinobacterium caligoides]
MAILERFSLGDLDAIRVGRANRGITLSFIIYRCDNTLIDFGPANQWQHVKPFIEEKTLDQLLLTHHHEDHSGNAHNIAKTTGLTPYTSSSLAHKMSEGIKVPYYRRIAWGSYKPTPFRTLPEHPLQLSNGDTIEALFTPGHTAEMHCFHLADRGWLFSADLYIANKISLMTAGEDVSLMIDSLQRCIELDFDTMFCAHRGIVNEGKSALIAKRNYLTELAEQCSSLWQQGHNSEHITLKLLGKEGMLKRVSNGKYCKHNLIKSCLKHHQLNPNERP